MTRLSRAEILRAVNERPDLFHEALIKRLEGYAVPSLSCQTAIPTSGGGVDLSAIPEFRTWLGKTTVDMSRKGAEAFLDVFIELQGQTIGMQDDQTELLQQNRELLAENKRLRLEIRRLQGKTTPLDWDNFAWDDNSLPWSRSPE
jgi:hypothetical protein